MSRPALRYKVLNSTAQEWFGRPLRTIPDADVWRYQVCRVVAATIEMELKRRG